eukprot:TRINITY_DN4550_c0_g2_i1.p1 TRINITY_DN4550_c0_g2~~TRINITY_DN4550_c0_g2_i1.p1  ORF type:complete len:735 (+),score=86.34 TRINITY_DN4550_c0_g2_i1:23-2206(+)
MSGPPTTQRLRPATSAPALTMTSVVVVVVVVMGMVPIEGARVQAPNGTLYAWNPGARCVSRSDPAALLTDLCAGWINYDLIYIDDLQAQRKAKIEERVTTITSNSECIPWSYRVYCALMYRPCETVDIPGYGSVATGQYVCQHMCTSRNTTCYQQYLDFGVSVAGTKSALSCTAPYPYDFGYPDLNVFPTTNYTYPLTVLANNASYTGEVSSSCFDGNQNLLGDFDKITCPSGTYNPSPTECALNCPQPLISDAEYRAADITFYIVGWFSFSLTAFVVVSYLLNAFEKIRYPNSLTFFFVCCIMCVSFVFVLGSFVQQENMRCTSVTEPNTWGYGWCTVQGVTYVYFTLAGALWWLMIGITMFLTIAFRFKPQEIQLFTVWSGKRVVWLSQLVQGVMHAICWGVPLIVVIIALSAHKIGYGPSDFWCTLHSGEDIRVTLGDVFVELTGVDKVQEVDLWNLLLLTIPIFCITLIGTLLLGLVLVFAWIKSRQGLLFLRHQWRLLVLMLIYLWVYTFVFGYRVQITSERHKQYDDYVNFINCQKSTTTRDPNCHLSTEVVYPLWFIAGFNVAAQGIFVFFIYGTSRGIAKSWGRLFKLCKVNVPCVDDEMSSSTTHNTSNQTVTGTVIKGRKITESQIMADQISESDDDSQDDATEGTTEDDRSVPYLNVSAQMEAGSSLQEGTAATRDVVDRTSMLITPRAADIAGAASSSSGDDDMMIEMEQMVEHV